MAENDYQTLRINAEALETLRLLANRDKRSMGQEAAHLIEMEYARRFPQPSPAIIESDAVLASKQ